MRLHPRALGGHYSIDCVSCAQCLAPAWRVHRLLWTSHIVLLCAVAACCGSGSASPTLAGQTVSKEEGQAGGLGARSRVEARDWGTQMHELNDGVRLENHGTHGSMEWVRRRLQQQPYVSVVLVMRNDDYGGNLLHRFERSIADLAEAALHHGLHYELLIIEWNPPAAHARLREAVAWPDALLDVRIITVSANLHAEALCLGWEYEAKNLGVALARGKFVLTSNADIILSDALVAFLATQALNDDSFYRADRHDCIELIPRNYTAARAQRHCSAHAVRHLYSWGLEWYPLPTSATPQVCERESRSFL